MLTTGRRTYLIKTFRRVLGLFWPNFASNYRGYIRKLILPLQFDAKFGSKEPENRLKFFNEIGSQEISLYFHIPFCSKKCPYCHFFVLPDKESLKKQLLDALQLEWNKQLPLLAGAHIVSIYFGGGTPALFGSRAIHTILNWVRNSGVSIDTTCEITLETNPECTTYALLKEMREAGVNRLSIGVQSLDDTSLQTLGRTHAAHAAKRAIEDAARAGFSNLSIDLMYDLPGQTYASWQRTLLQLEQLPLTHLSLYNLTIEPETLFFKKRKQLAPTLPEPEESLRMLEAAVTQLEQIGLNRYEISAFAKKGFSSRHNTGYWQARPFWGFGPSAFSYWNKKRLRNVAHLGKYASALQENRSPIDFEEQLLPGDALKELLAVELRLLTGVHLPTFERRHDALPAPTRTAIASLIAQGWLHLDDNHLRLTQQGLLFYDSVATALI